MAPLLRPGVVVLATGGYRKLSVGDVVILYHDGLEKIKRISRIQDENIYVLGDNAAASTDSRQFGYLPVSCIVGKVIWPLNSNRL